MPTNDLRLDLYQGYRPGETTVSNDSEFIAAPDGLGPEVELVIPQSGLVVIWAEMEVLQASLESVIAQPFEPTYFPSGITMDADLSSGDDGWVRWFTREPAFKLTPPGGPRKFDLRYKASAAGSFKARERKLYVGIFR